MSGASLPAYMFMALKRRAVRAPTNPADKATIVSIYPREIDEVKHTIQPGRFVIPAGSYENPAILVVGPSSWWREFDAEQPLLEIPVSAIQIADSIVKDYCNGIFLSNMGDSMPGMFYVPGAYDLAGIRKNYPDELELANERQTKWLHMLVQAADSLWARSNGNPLSISDDMRMAARLLNQTKDWMKNFQAMEMVRCIACGSLMNPQFPVCPACKCINSQSTKDKLVFVGA